MPRFFSKFRRNLKPKTAILFFFAMLNVIWAGEQLDYIDDIYSLIKLWILVEWLE